VSVTSDSPTEDGQRFMVLVNGEGQYGLHPADAELPDGWRADGRVRTEADCVRYVDERWTDLRPLRLRAVGG
jgi:MbtH protein